MSLPKWTISELQEKMKSGELTARQLAVLYLEQIDSIDKSGPYVMGISFFAKAWQEPTLIKLAYSFEQATQFRRPPRFLPTANLSL